MSAWPELALLLNLLGSSDTSVRAWLATKILLLNMLPLTFRQSLQWRGFSLETRRFPSLVFDAASAFVILFNNSTIPLVRRAIFTAHQDWQICRISPVGECLRDATLPVAGSQLHRILRAGHVCLHRCPKCLVQLIARVSPGLSNDLPPPALSGTSSIYTSL